MNLFNSPSVGFEAPFDMLQACHERVERMLALLERLAAYLADHLADPTAQQAAHDVMRYFDMAAPHHHEDEERHVLPRLRQTGHAALADRLAQDHQRMTTAWAALRVQLVDLQAGIKPATDTWPAFVALYRAHIALEEGEAFVLGAQGLNAADLAHMGQEMESRRRG
ncbi:hemerythrin domain-containing protein [Inhella gelatinilytica]|uniref:Hemerythrin domain-containing protein n=1 Tax=Inhella gelatinilytica TaxID=2795030 RepID=A0A931IV46_9BURK|nr:hemerythrin domain-containing protein [Inhella gelatinilytica]MBH9552116.1 hemerythrin domain-containing protein [Inhella gelatinilytica]